MSSGGATTKGGPAKGTQQQNPSHTLNNNSKKASKSDSKSDKVDLNPKIQATAEQMQIAKIIDTHRAEDPELRRKIHQVMEITRTTEDQASMALHSREYDIEQAITLLTDGGSQSLESEWAQAGKKRKVKTPNQKSEAAAAKDVKGGKEGDRHGRDKSEKRDSKGEKKDLEGGDQPFIGGERGERRNDSRGGGRGGGLNARGGRGGRPGHSGRGGGRNDKENEELLKSGRITNGPGRGGSRGGGFGARGGGRGGGRTFANRARGGDREGGESYHPSIDVWENSQADGTKEAPLKVDKWGAFPPADDWDNEEYTGTFTESKVFTPSSQTAQAPLNDTTNGVGGSGPTNHIQPSSNPTAADILKMNTNQDSSVTMSNVVQGINGTGSGQSMDLGMLLSKQNSTGATTNPGVNLLASLQSSYSNASQMSIGSVSNNQGLPARNKTQRPRGPPSKIPSSAVEMPDDPATSTLDVQFGGMDLSSESALSFSSVAQGKQPLDSSSLIYGGQGKLDNFASATSGDKDISNKATGHSSPSPFQAPINNQSQGSLSDSNKVNSVASNITPGIDTLTNLSQNQTKQTTGPSSYGAAVNSQNSGSAFVSYGGSNKGAPGFAPAPGFPPVSQNNNAAGTYNTTTVASVPPSYASQQPNQGSAAAYMTNLAYGSQTSSQPAAAAASSQNVPYASGNAAPPSAYQMNSGYNSSGSTQYGNYGQKLSGLSATTGAKDSTTDVNSTAPVTSVSVSSVQMGSSIQAGSGEELWPYGSDLSSVSSASNAKMSAPATTNANSKVSSAMPPGMMVQPQYILGQGGSVPAYYNMQTPMYAYEDNSMQFVPRFPNMGVGGYYDASGNPQYGMPVAAGVSGRNDSATMQGYTTGADARFQRSDNSSTASPVPSNLAGGSAQQAMYPGMPYYFLGNNMVHSSHAFPYGPPHQMYQPPMATPTNTSGPPHAATANQYQKNVYNPTQYTYDTSQGAQSGDFGKSSYSSGPVGPNSNSSKVAPSSATGTSQSTDINSYKGHSMPKMNSYDKQYNSGSGQSAYSTGAQPINSQYGSGYGVFIAQQPVQTLPPMHQDVSSASRAGPGGQQKGKQQQYQGPYWGN